MDLVEQMSGNPVKVFHYVFRLAECIVIDPLQYVVQTDPALIEGQLIGVIDIAAAERYPHQKIAVHYEIVDDLLEFSLSKIHFCMPLLLCCQKSLAG